jgi:hypothetical protein
MVGGPTITGTVSDGTEVDVIGEAEFLGQKYFQIRDAAKEGSVDGPLPGAAIGQCVPALPQAI